MRLNGPLAAAVACAAALLVGWCGGQSGASERVGVAVRVAETADSMAAVAHRRAEALASLALERSGAVDTVRIPEPVPARVVTRVDTLLIRVADTVRVALEEAIGDERGARDAVEDSLRTACAACNEARLTLVLGLDAASQGAERWRLAAEANERLAEAALADRGASWVERGLWLAGGVALGVVIAERR